MLETPQEEEARGVEDEITIRGVKPWDPVLHSYPLLAGCERNNPNLNTPGLGFPSPDREDYDRSEA